ncbi:hypothetical protein GCM10022252_76430 [Streptosporangium oxazolinicum]|uniref:Uncharacterized protein n=1 Tax=Streptosporangium oxazolinicum TaxID=909287 RepID=A0ABP8BL90_9ACTN
MTGGHARLVLEQLRPAYSHQLIQEAFAAFGADDPMDDVLIAAATRHQEEFAKAHRIFGGLPSRTLNRLIAEAYPIIPGGADREESICFIADRAIEQGVAPAEKEPT